MFSLQKVSCWREMDRIVLCCFESGPRHHNGFNWRGSQPCLAGWWRDGLSNPGEPMTIPLHTFENTDDPCVDLEYWFARNPDVLSHSPEKIAREAVKFMDVQRAPQRCGIYFLIKGDRIVYIGKAQSIYKRVEDHWRMGKSFERYWCFGGIPYMWLGHAEGYYIKRCKPFLNVERVPYDPILDKIARKHRQTWKVNEMIESGDLVLDR